jgi:hypothetical protein
MKLDNRTKYDTRTLRRILIAVFREQSGVFQARIPQWDRLQVRISYARPGVPLYMVGALREKGLSDAADAIAARRARHVTGCAYVRGRWTELRVPSGVVALDRLAAVWIHELWHIAGSHHEGFPESVMRCHTAPFAWVVEQFGATLAEAAPKPKLKPVRDLVAERRTRLETRLAGWESRLRRAEKAVSKLNRQLRYYDRREKLAAGKASS